MPMKVMVLGQGGREHALAWKLSLSSLTQVVYVGPGNKGMEDSKIVALEIPLKSESQFQELVKFVKEEGIGLVVVGPENLLAQGVVDHLEREGIPTLGPTQAATQLESSKIFAKELMKKAGVPSAPFLTFKNPQEALAYLRNEKNPWENEESSGVVIKVDSLAAGKGVLVCSHWEQGTLALEDFLVNQGSSFSATPILLEKKLSGREVSAFALCDGQDFVIMGFACDYKRIYDGDQGPNTGGMGAYTPVGWLTQEMKAKISSQVFSPVLSEMKKRQRPFKGILFAGLMIEGQEISVLEFNCRLGDPETQVLLPVMEQDFFPWAYAAATGNLQSHKVKVGGLDFELCQGRGSAVHVVMAAQGYPIQARMGDSITLGQASGQTLGQTFFAGVEKSGEEWRTHGGRVLGVTAVGKNLSEAREKAYQEVKGISFAGAQFRQDIGQWIP